jgi:hypothetical protein
MQIGRWPFGPNKGRWYVSMYDGETTPDFPLWRRVSPNFDDREEAEQWLRDHQDDAAAEAYRLQQAAELLAAEGYVERDDATWYRPSP